MPRPSCTPAEKRATSNTRLGVLSLILFRVSTLKELGVSSSGARPRTADTASLARYRSADVLDTVNSDKVTTSSLAEDPAVDDDGACARAVKTCATMALTMAMRRQRTATGGV